MVRSFVAVKLGSSIAARIDQQIPRSVKGIRWESPDKFHITLKFLGEVEDVAPLQAALSQLRPAPFDVVVRGFGLFPNVIWVGCEGPWAPLAGAVENVCASLGFQRESRAFHAHITVGRVKDRRARPKLDPAVEFGRQRVDAFYLMKSELRPTGSVYSELATFPLHG